MSAEVLTGLRRWSAGSATDAAAVELLALVDKGRLLRVSADLFPVSRTVRVW